MSELPEWAIFYGCCTFLSKGSIKYAENLNKIWSLEFQFLKMKMY